MTSNQLGDANELARRFVACKGWRWVAGMLATDGWRVAGREGDLILWGRGREVTGLSVRSETNGNPDLSDAATRGAILELVRGAWGDPLAYVGYFAPHWKVIGSHQNKTETPASWGCLLGRGDTEIEALLAALVISRCFIEEIKP